MGLFKTLCLKGCGGGSFCKHGRLRPFFKERGCGGGSICKHGRRRIVCKEDGCGKQLSAVLSAKDDARAKQAKPNGVIFVVTLTAARPLQTRAGRMCLLLTVCRAFNQRRFCRAFSQRPGRCRRGGADAAGVAATIASLNGTAAHPAAGRHGGGDATRAQAIAAAGTGAEAREKQVRARPPEKQVQGLPRLGHLRARPAEAPL